MQRKNYWRQFVSFNLPKRKTPGDGDNDGFLGRKTFWRSVSGEPGDGVVAEEPSASSKGGEHVTIEFSLERLREFKAQCLNTSSFHKKTEPRLKRPNYNNARRRLLSKPRTQVM